MPQITGKFILLCLPLGFVLELQYRTAGAEKLCRAIPRYRVIMSCNLSYMPRVSIFTTAPRKNNQSMDMLGRLEQNSEYLFIF